MNSEKVKEIKEALEDNANYEHHNKLGYIDGYKCKTVAYADILTLINELESENANQKEHIELLFRQNEEKKDRIVELETENALIKNSVAMRGYNTLEEISNNKVKQFAERLKEKAIRRQEFIGELAIDDVEYVKTQDIDETLKEFEK